MKKVFAAVAVVSLLVAATPRKADAGVLEGALIGAAIGGAVGVVMTLFKPKPAVVPADTASAARSDTTSAVAPAPTE